MIEKKNVIITRIEDLPSYGKKGYNSDEIVNVSNNTTEQPQQNADQSQGDDKGKGR